MKESKADNAKTNSGTYPEHNILNPSRKATDAAVKEDAGAGREVSWRSR